MRLRLWVWLGLKNLFLESILGWGIFYIWGGDISENQNFKKLGQSVDLIKNIIMLVNFESPFYELNSPHLCKLSMLKAPF